MQRWGGEEVGSGRVPLRWRWSVCSAHRTLQGHRHPQCSRFRAPWLQGSESRLSGAKGGRIRSSASVWAGEEESLGWNGTARAGLFCFHATLRHATPRRATDLLHFFFSVEFKGEPGELPVNPVGLKVNSSVVILFLIFRMCPRWNTVVIFVSK